MTSLQSPDGQSAPRLPVDGTIAVPPEGSSDRELITAVTAALIAGASAWMLARILGRFADLTSYIAREIIDTMGWNRLLLTATADEFALLPRHRTASVMVLRTVATQNAFRRATYLINATRRLAPAFRARGEGADERRTRAIHAERRWWEAHRAAERKRNESGRRVAEAVARLDPGETKEVLLGWKATLDERTSRDCRAAHKRNFNALVPPPIGYPGTVHLFCRCLPVPPWPTRRRVEDVRPD